MIKILYHSEIRKMDRWNIQLATNGLGMGHDWRKSAFSKFWST